MTFRLLDGGGFTQISLDFLSAGTYAEGQGYDRLLDFGGASIKKVDSGALSIENRTSGSEVVVNEGGIDNDFRVEGDTVTDVFKVDAGTEQLIAGAFFNIKDRGELTVSAGSITVTGSGHSVDTESDASTDDLDSINGGNDGDILILRTINSTRDVTCKDGTGNLRLAGDFVLTSVTDFIMLRKVGNDWYELSRSSNA